MSEDASWWRRQWIASLGFVPIVALLLGAAVGRTLANAVGVHELVGALLGALVGYFGSRAILRRAYDSELR